MQNGIVMYHQGTLMTIYFLVCIKALLENTSLESRIKSPDETRDFKEVSISGVSSLVWSSILDQLRQKVIQNNFAITAPVRIGCLPPRILAKLVCFNLSDISVLISEQTKNRNIDRNAQDHWQFIEFILGFAHDSCLL